MPTIVDLFCGAGGLSAGLKNAGFQTVFAADENRAAVTTFNLNVAPCARVQSLSCCLELPPADLFVGGPPCQGFSSAGNRAAKDARNSMVAVFANLIARHRPAAFLFENVEGFLTGENGKWVFDLLDPLVEAGYCVHLRKVNAAHYGIPQHRKRVFAIGGLGWDPGFPPITHSATGMPGTKLIGRSLPSCPSIADALAGLPVARPRIARCRSTDDHDFREPCDVDLRRIKALAPGQTMKDLPEDLWHETYRRRAYRRVMDGTPTERRGGAPAGLRRLAGDQPSKAITSGAVSEFVHPTEDRTLTLRECARVQTFPDRFLFAGTLSERARLIGNAVPPKLAEVFGLHLEEAMRTRSSRSDAPGLKSFEATVAKAMSPALKRTALRIHERYLADRTAQLSLL